MGTTIIGLLFLTPVVVLGIVLGKAFNFMRRGLQPLTALIPQTLASGPARRLRPGTTRSDEHETRRVIVQVPDSEYCGSIPEESERSLKPPVFQTSTFVDCPGACCAIVRWR